MSLDNPLVREPLRTEHVKPRLLGHFGTTPGLNLVNVHLNRAIVERELEAMLVVGPGHGGPACVANAYLEGTYSELYSGIGTDLAGLRALFRQFSFPGGIPSHAAPETPGSINEGGELGYSLVHAFGAAFDNPDLLVVCVVGDGEAETGPLATSWHSNKLLDARRDGVVLPILHLNGYKIANPTILARIPEEDLLALLRGYGWEPHVVSGGFDGEPAEPVHRRLAETLDSVLDAIEEIQRRAREGSAPPEVRWPMIVLRTPKGWTGPEEIDGKQIEGTWRSHQVPIPTVRESPDHLSALEAWLRSYRPEELFDDNGALVEELAALPPRGARRMSASPHANGGELLRALDLPDFREYGISFEGPAVHTSEATRVLGGFLRGLFNSYEAFVHVVDSMFNQHAKWLESARKIPWRRPVASLNYLLSSHVWRQDHNGFSHQDPGFLDVVVNKRAEVVRVYLPPDANTLLSVADHCLRSRDYVNVIVAGKQPALDYLTMDEAIAHCTRGLGIWDWASTDEGREPDVVLACCGDIPTLETVAAASILRERLPDLAVRVVNVVDLMRLQPDSIHPHGLEDREFDSLFTVDRPIVFAFHGYPSLVHRLTYRRTNHGNLHVHGFQEQGTTTTPFDMVMLNDLDRFRLVVDVVDRVPGLAASAAHLRDEMEQARLEARAWTREHGEDLPAIRDWTWPY